LAANDDPDPDSCFQSLIGDFKIPRDGTYYVGVTTFDNDPILDADDVITGWEDDGQSSVEFDLNVYVFPQVAGRYVFYNNSSFDDNNETPNTEDHWAIAIDKEALLPGETATLTNYTSYSRGINGVMLDIRDLPDGVTPQATDFAFRMGNSPDLGTWEPAPAPRTIAVRRGEGPYGSDRVTIVWDDNVIQNQWLQVTVKANENTALAEDDVFYFGNAIGESGNSPTDAKVNAIDVLFARNNPRSLLSTLWVDFRYDYNRDGRVNATDMLLARENQTHLLDALELISVSGDKSEARMTNDEDGGDSSFAIRDSSLFYEFERMGVRSKASKKDRADKAAVGSLPDGYEV